MRDLIVMFLVACSVTAPPDDAVPTADTVGSPTPGTSDTGPSGPPNVLLVVLDDVGRDMIGAYRQHPDSPPTPHLDGLAAEGVRFTHAWAMPACAPARATILTGRHGPRTGIGGSLPPLDPEAPGLALAEVTLAELLRGAPTPYATAAVGKWHLGTPASGGLAHPGLQGFEVFRGAPGNLTVGHSLDGLPQSYTDWVQVEDGEAARASGFLTERTADDALDLARDLPEPWFVYAAFHAAHGPYEVPPARWIATPLDALPTPRRRYLAMVEALDALVGRVVDGLAPEVRARTVVVVLGDNGTPGEVTTPPFAATAAKKSLGEGGVGVPLIVAGPGVARGAVVDLPMSTVDLLPTLAELAGVDAAARIPGLDGASVLPWLRDPDHDGAHPLPFATQFSDASRRLDPAHRFDAVRDRRFKLLRGPESAVLIDLGDAVVEQPEHLVVPPYAGEAAQAFARLGATLDAYQEAFTADPARPAR